MSKKVQRTTTECFAEDLESSMVKMHKFLRPLSCGQDENCQEKCKGKLTQIVSKNVSKFNWFGSSMLFYWISSKLFYT